MYAETFGIQNPSPAIEAAAKWVQWAQAGILAGAIENEATIRYNLDQFWKAKAAAYPAASAQDRGNLERLDTFAQGLWGALESGKIYSSSPSYWDYWRAYWSGGTPMNADSIAAANAAAAAAVGQKAAAERAAAASPTQAAFGTVFSQYATRAAAAIPQDVAAASKNWYQTGVNPLGIPLIGWAAIAVGVILVAAAPRR